MRYNSMRMITRTKLGLAVTCTSLLILIGTIGAWMMAEVVFNKSYMMTQDALSDPGTSLHLRIQLIFCLAVVATGIAGLFKTVGKLRK